VSVGLPFFSAIPLGLDLASLAPLRCGAFVWRPSPSVGCRFLTQRGPLVRNFGGRVADLGAEKRVGESRRSVAGGAAD
jgi:hypothetical protein